MKTLGKSLLLLLPGLLFAGLGLLAVSRPHIQFPFTETMLAGKEKRLQNTCQNLAQLSRENRQLSEELAAMQIIRTNATTEKESNAQALLRERLEVCTNQAGVQIRSLGDVRSNPLSEEVIVYELSMAADCRIEELDQLLALLIQGKPRLYWKTFTIRTNVHTPGQLQLNGTITTLSFPAGGEDE